MKFGIDFGTSFCTMCRLNSDGKPEVIRDECGDEKIPSLVYWGEDGIKVGQAAKDMLDDVARLPENERFEPMARIIKSVKRNFYPDRTIYLPDGTLITPLDVVREILKYLKRNAETLSFHEKVTSVSLTHPVAFTMAQKELLKKAALQAGFQSVELLEEPVAAALGYLASGAKVGQNILIYDLGGGTFDLAFVRREDDGTLRIPVAPCGDPKCGGDDFDQLIYDFAEKDFRKTIGGELFANPDLLDLDFLFLCRQAKEKLARNEKAAVRHFSQEKSYSVGLTRKDLHELIAEKLNNSIRLTEQLLNRVKSANYEIDTVILIGGSTRLPMLEELLNRVLPVKPLKTMLVDSAVAMGAVVEKKLSDNLEFILSSSSKLELIKIKSGEFMMGSPEGEDSREEENEIQHLVRLPHDYWMGKYVVTQEQYEAVMGKNPSFFKGENLPVEMVDWNDAMKFCEQLNLLLQDQLPNGYHFSLPTEAQWEYACRAGTTSAYYVVTQEQYEAVMGKNPSFFKGENLPVEMVDWNDAMKFCEQLNLLLQDQLPNGYHFSLPTEAQWEYACRAGTTSAYFYGNASDSSKMNFNGNFPCGGGPVTIYRERTLPVDSFEPNAWGLYNMHGNVWEWCLDFCAAYDLSIQNDPRGPSMGTSRVTRGGACFYCAQGCRSAKRNSSTAPWKNKDLGFRVILCQI